MKRLFALSLIAAETCIAAPLITVTPTLGPDFATSPNFNAWAVNVVNSIVLNSPQGPVSAVNPQNYTPLSSGANVDPRSVITTPFSSWKGVANPGGLFTAELGTALYFSLEITGDQNNQFTLNQLGAQETYLGQTQTAYLPGDFANGSNSGVFSSLLVGQRARGGFTDGSDTGNTPLVALWYVGVGFTQGLDSAATGTGQQKIDATAASMQSLPDRTTQVCYSLGTVASGCGNVNITGAAIQNVPEPGTMALVGLALAGLAVKRHRFAPSPLHS